MTFIENNEGIIRLSIFAGVFLLMALSETLFPRKQRSMTRSKRWFTNWALVIIDSLAVRFLVPILAIGMATIATERGWGLLALVQAPMWVKVLTAIILLDMLIYAQHVASHKIEILWRFHKVHHVDRDIDVTTGARFHPIEILFSMAFKVGCVIVIGAPVLAVFLFEVILNASAMFNHSNVKLPIGVDRVVRKIIVTPDMHRVHHSVLQKETDSNYGFFLSIWDRLFKTYIDQPKSGHDDMTIGLIEHQDQQPASLIWSLLLPFKKVKKAE